MIICNKFLDFAYVVILFSVQPSSAAAPVRRSKCLLGAYDLITSTCQQLHIEL